MTLWPFSPILRPSTSVKREPFTTKPSVIALWGGCVRSHPHGEEWPLTGIEERYWWYRIELQGAADELAAHLVDRLAFRGRGAQAPPHDDYAGFLWGCWTRLRLVFLRYRLAVVGLEYRDFVSLVHEHFGPAFLAVANGTVALTAMGQARRVPRSEWPRFKVGPGHKAKVPTDEEWWGRSLNETRATGGSLTKLQRWEIVGDFAEALYQLLARRIPAERRVRAPEIGRVPSTFNRRAMRLTARALNLLLAETIQRPLTARDIATRLQARGRRAGRYDRDEPGRP